MKTDNQAGFSVLEALVALSVFALTAAAFYQGLSQGFRGLRAIAKDQAALAVASQQLASVGVVSPLTEGTTDGSSPGGFSWTTTVTPYLNTSETLKDAAFPAYWVTVRVDWREGLRARAQSVELKTLKLGTAAP